MEVMIFGALNASHPFLARERSVAVDQVAEIKTLFVDATIH